MIELLKRLPFLSVDRSCLRGNSRDAVAKTLLAITISTVPSTISKDGPPRDTVIGFYDRFSLAINKVNEVA